MDAKFFSNKPITNSYTSVTKTSLPKTLYPPLPVPVPCRRHDLAKFRRFKHKLVSLRHHVRSLFSEILSVLAATREKKKQRAVKSAKLRQFPVVSCFLLGWRNKPKTSRSSLAIMRAPGLQCANLQSQTRQDIYLALRHNSSHRCSRQFGGKRRGGGSSWQLSTEFPPAVTSSSSSVKTDFPAIQSC